MKSSTPQIESNYFASELLIPDGNLIQLAVENYTCKQIASVLGVHTELTMVKAQLLNSRDHKN